jgi:hypothetical protein
MSPSLGSAARCASRSSRRLRILLPVARRIRPGGRTADRTILLHARVCAHAGGELPVGSPDTGATLHSAVPRHRADNAMYESFFATLECELLARRRFASQAEARMAVFSYIEGWYNPARRHSGIHTYPQSPTRCRYSRKPKRPKRQTVHRTGSTPAGQWGLVTGEGFAIDVSKSDHFNRRVFTHGIACSR